MSTIAKFAWPIQIAIFVILFFTIPQTPSRIFIIFGYIFASSMVVRFVKNKYQ